MYEYRRRPQAKRYAVRPGDVVSGHEVLTEWSVWVPIGPFRAGDERSCYSLSDSTASS